MDDKASRNPSWVARFKPFFNLPNPIIFRLFLISSNATFFLGVAMLIEWFVHARHHTGYHWFVYYASVMMALPLFVWIICLFFAITFYKTRKTHLSPPYQVVQGQVTNDQTTQEQTSSTNMVSISLAHYLAVHSPPETISGREALALPPPKAHNDDSKITSENIMTLTIKGEEDSGQTQPDEEDNQGHDNKEIKDMGPLSPREGSQPNGSKEDKEKGEDLAHDEELPTTMTSGIGTPEGKNHKATIVNISFSVPMSYTRSLKLNRSASF